MKKLFLLAVFASTLLACQEAQTTEQDSAASITNLPETQATSPTANSEIAAAEAMRATALEETDTLGRLRQSFVALQEEFVKSKGIVPDVGDVKVTVDEKHNLRIENKLNGHTYLTVVKVADLQSKDNGMMLLPDSETRKFPGLNIKVKPGRPKAQLFKDGKLEKELDFIEFSLKDRPSMERVVPAIVQAMNIVNGSN